jgi:hypothetical protein
MNGRKTRMEVGVSMLETKIGSYSFSNTTVVPGAWSLDGADVGTVLNKKCPK